MSAERRRLAAIARANREEEREARRRASLDRQRYVANREEQVRALNADLEEQIDELSKLLIAGIEGAEPVDFDTLKRVPDSTPFVPQKPPTPELAPSVDKYVPGPLAGLQSLFPWARKAHAQATQLALKRFEDDCAKHRDREASLQQAFQNAVNDARAAHERALQKSEEETDRWNKEVEQFSLDYKEGQSSAVIDYCRLVLERSDYPGTFPKAAKLAYLQDSKQLVVEYELPTVESVPEVAAYKYVKNKNEVTTTQRSAAQRRSLYVSIIAQTTLRTLHEVFVSDKGNYVDSIVVNGHVNAIDRGTGQAVTHVS